MIILGLLLFLGVAGIALAAFLTNDNLFGAAAGTVELFGYRTDATVGQVFIAGAAAGAVLLLGLYMIFSGAGHRARKRAATRRELAAQRKEMYELQRKHDSVASELAAQKTAEEDAARTS